MCVCVCVCVCSPKNVLLHVTFKCFISVKCYIVHCMVTVLSTSRLLHSGVHMLTLLGIHPPMCSSSWKIPSVSLMSETAWWCSISSRQIWALSAPVTLIKVVRLPWHYHHRHDHIPEYNWRDDVHYDVDRVWNVHLLWTSRSEIHRKENCSPLCTSPSNMFLTPPK